MLAFDPPGMAASLAWMKPVGNEVGLSQQKGTFHNAATLSEEWVGQAGCHK